MQDESEHITTPRVVSSLRQLPTSNAPDGYGEGITIQTSPTVNGPSQITSVPVALMTTQAGGHFQRNGDGHQPVSMATALQELQTKVWYLEHEQSLLYQSFS